MISTSMRKLSHLILLSALSFPANTAPVHWKNNDYILKSFLDITLNREHGGQAGHVNKWLTPIRYYIVDRTGDQDLHQRMVTDHLHHLSTITSLDITPVEQPEDANLRILFSSEQHLDQHLLENFGLSNQSFRQQIIRDSVCLARVRTSSNGEINAAAVIIPVDRARAHGKLMSCVVEELTQILGLVNDSNQVFPSIFNDRSFNDFLSGLDFILLKLLYESEVKPGMDHTEVKKQVTSLLSRPGFQSVIESAEQKVRENSLENWLN